jgi:UDP-N-acetylglucosamine 2-epimerase (non-hydrolysing)
MTRQQGAVCHITGARPNFPKAAPVMRALDERGVAQRLVHTGQHYDDNMSTIFFQQLELPTPDVNLGVGSGSHAAQTGAIMVALERLFIEEQPSLVVVYGDVNSTVAAALVASKLGIASAHVEAGLRSFDMSMPEEINRLVTDRLSDLLFATSADAVAHLGNEGVHPDKIHFVGNPMIDTLLAHLDRFGPQSFPPGLDLPDRFAVATLHRPGNVEVLVEAMHGVADQVPIVMPVHPRGRQRMTEAGLFDHPGMVAVEPLGYIEFLSLVRASALVVTDSGGIQEETTILGVPCLTLRPNTERPITITHGTNRLTTPQQVPTLAREVLAAGRPETWPTPPLWDGAAGGRIADVVARFVGDRSAER